MSSQSDYFVVRTGALPEVLKKVVEVKRLLETEKGLSVAEGEDHHDHRADAGCTRKSGEDLLDGVFV